MIIRANQALPPSGPREEVLMAEAICLGTIVAWSRGTWLPGRAALLMRHAIDHSSASELARLLAADAAARREALARLGIAAAPTGSGRRRAPDAGGRILHLLGRVYPLPQAEMSPLDAQDVTRRWVMSCEDRFAKWLAAWPATGELIGSISSPLLLDGEISAPALAWTVAQARAEWVVGAAEAAAAA